MTVNNRIMKPTLTLLTALLLAPLAVFAQEKPEVANADDANKLLHRDYRNGWGL